MASIDLNQIYSDLQAQNYSIVPKVDFNSFAFKYHSVYGISYCLAQSDPIKQQHSLYIKKHQPPTKTPIESKLHGLWGT
jgi:hypothetical protein